MSKKQSAYANQLKRTIKTGMNALGMDDGTYRLMLKTVSQSVSGNAKNSITKMNIDELKAVVEHLRERGFTPKRGKLPTGKSKSPQSFKSSRAQPANSPTLQDKIRAVWINMSKQGIVRDGSDEALNHFARKRVNRKRLDTNDALVMRIDGMTTSELIIVLETLKSWQHRELTKQREY